MTFETGRAGVNVVALFTMIVVNLVSIVVLMTEDALENRIVRLHHVAVGARVPFATMLATVNREENVVIPGRRLPGIGRMAVFTTFG